ncbi:unnamed protein product, partial [Rotaria magnacalcarata]
PIAITTTDYSAKHSTNNSDIIQSTAEASMLTPSHDQNENNISVYSKLQQPSSPLSDLSIVISMEAVDEPPNNNDKDDQHRA